jgi:hypothetical protein
MRYRPRSRGELTWELTGDKIAGGTQLQDA